MSPKKLKISSNTTAIYLLFCTLLIGSTCIIHAAPSSQHIELPVGGQTDQRQYLDRSEILSAFVVAPSRVPANNTVNIRGAVGGKNTTTSSPPKVAAKSADKVDIKLVIKEKELDRMNRTQVEYHLLTRDIRSSRKAVPSG